MLHNFFRLVNRPIGIVSCLPIERLRFQRPVITASLIHGIKNGKSTFQFPIKEIRGECMLQTDSKLVLSDTTKDNINWLKQQRINVNEITPIQFKVQVGFLNSRSNFCHMFDKSNEDLLAWIVNNNKIDLDNDQYRAKFFEKVGNSYYVKYRGATIDVDITDKSVLDLTSIEHMSHGDLYKEFYPERVDRINRCIHQSTLAKN